MSSYICTKCGCIDNSACGGNYWNVKSKLSLFKEDYANEQLLCTECTPTEYSDGTSNNEAGRWHGHFERKHWSEYGTKEHIIRQCKKNQGSYVNAIEYFEGLEKGIYSGEYNEKGKYYSIVLKVLGVNPRTMEGGIPYVPKFTVTALYQNIPHYFKEPHKVDMEEFKQSVRWAFADVFEGGCEFEEPEGFFDNIDRDDKITCEFCLRADYNMKLSEVNYKGNKFQICDKCLSEGKHINSQD